MVANCSSSATESQPCVSDGDTVETVLMIGNDSGVASERSEVRLTSQIQALPSCAQSTACGVARPRPPVRRLNGTLDGNESYIQRGIPNLNVSRPLFPEGDVSI